MAGKSTFPLFPGLEGADNCPSYRIESRYLGAGASRIAGVDEAGRGPLAGPVVAAAVILPADEDERSIFRGIRDSKLLSHESRAELYEVIASNALGVAWALREPAYIDETNILAASLDAMREAVEGLNPAADLCLVDGNQPLPSRVPSKPVVKGDRICLSIAAASIVAKVVRDRIMIEMDKLYPGYGFGTHKGYPTAAHKKAIASLGPCPAHRRTYKGVKEFIG